MTECDFEHGAWGRRDLVIAAVLGGLHLAMSAIYGFGLGVTNVHPVRTWDHSWQSISLSLLRERPWESLWYHHAQPPLWNLMGVVLSHLSPDQFMLSIQVVYAILGAAMAAMLYLIVRQFCRSRQWALTWAALLALNPATFLFEAYHLYTLPVAVLVVTSVFAVAWYQQSRCAAAVVALALAVNGLVLMRSLFSIVLLPALLVLIVVLVGGRRWRVITLCLLLCIPSVGWYAKNQALFGFFGSSSWSGLSLWKVATWDHSEEEIRALGEEGMIDDVVVDHPTWFIPPHELADQGFGVQSQIPVLARNDYNNINIPAISSLYGSNALRVIRQAPQRYLKTMAKAYVYFCRPSARFKHLEENRRQIIWHDRLYSDVMLGGAVMGPLGSLLFFLLPIGFVIHAVDFVRHWRRRGLLAAVREDAVLLWCLFLILYVLAVSTFLEISENDRFKYLVEALIWIWLPVVVWRFWDLRAEAWGVRCER